MSRTDQRFLMFLMVLLFLGMTPSPAVAQIAVQGGSSYNSMSILDPDPLSGDITSSGDLFLSNDLELGSELYLDGVIFMQRQQNPNAPNTDQVIYFARGGDPSSEQFGWDASDISFVLSDDLRFVDVAGFSSAQITSDGGLGLETDSTLMYFLLDADNDDDAGTFAHLFTWYNNNTTSGSRAMELRSTGPSPNLGNLTIAGSLTQDGFDLAEMFLAAETIQPGVLVAVDGSRPDAVRPARAGDGGRILGIVATKPGVILGGAAFSVDALRRQWGDDLADEFERERPALEAEVYAEHAGLRDEAAHLVSPGAFAQHLERRLDEPTRAIPTTSDDGTDVGPALPARPLLHESELEEAYAEAFVQHETNLFDAVLERFQERRFARVALSGRVPVQVDATFGSIEAGDPLTASPLPGVAMKAAGPGWIVGTALEAMPSGSGTILAFVNRHWYGGDEPGRLASLEADLAELRGVLAAMRVQHDELRASAAPRSGRSGPADLSAD